MFAWSLGIAVVVHVAAFALWPEVPVEPLDAGALVEREPEDADDELQRVRVTARFGPPRILALDGAWVDEPADRVLEAGRAIHLPEQCLGRVESVDGKVRLRVNGEGRVDLARIEEGSGSPCGDLALRAVAGDLWFRWLPDERFPAPVELIQPVRLSTAP